VEIQQPAAPPRPALSEMNLAAAEEWAVARGLPRYRGRQVYEALSRRAVQNAIQLTELPLALRQEIAEAHRVRTLDPLIHLRSSRDRSEKVLFSLHDGATIESVLIPASNPSGRARVTVCVSSQVGCPAGCTFCATGLAGFARNLSAAEIADQVQYFVHALRAEGKRVTNVVFMGMGEPFLNTRAVREAIASLTDPAGFNLGERHTTVSTVGIVPQIRSFADWAGQVNLAISLHAPNDGLRSRLVPYNKHFPIADLMAAVEEYYLKTRRRVSFEYVLLRSVNDTRELALQLAGLLKPLAGGAHVNLIPWNPFREGRFIRSEGPDAETFERTLRDAGINATIRYSKGLDISAACGQLREKAAKPSAAFASSAYRGAPSEELH